MLLLCNFLLILFFYLQNFVVFALFSILHFCSFYLVGLFLFLFIFEFIQSFSVYYSKIIKDICWCLCLGRFLVIIRLVE
jgi:hypothetical protein